MGWGKISKIVKKTIAFPIVIALIAGALPFILFGFLCYYFWKMINWAFSTVLELSFDESL